MTSEEARETLLKHLRGRNFSFTEEHNKLIETTGWAIPVVPEKEEVVPSLERVLRKQFQSECSLGDGVAGLLYEQTKPYVEDLQKEFLLDCADVFESSLDIPAILPEVESLREELRFIKILVRFFDHFWKTAKWNYEYESELFAPTVLMEDITKYFYWLKNSLNICGGLHLNKYWPPDEDAPKAPLREMNSNFFFGLPVCPEDIRDLFDRKGETYSPKLVAAICAWASVRKKRLEMKNPNIKKPGSQIDEWLDENLPRFLPPEKISDNVKRQIRTIANWDDTPGAPSSGNGRRIPPE